MPSLLGITRDRFHFVFGDRRGRELSPVAPTVALAGRRAEMAEAANGAAAYQREGAIIAIAEALANAEAHSCNISSEELAIAANLHHTDAEFEAVADAISEQKALGAIRRLDPARMVANALTAIRELATTK